MPYASTDELPAPVRGKYSEKCQRAYMHAFNSVHEDTGDEGRAAAAGHSAAQKCEAKNDSMDAIQTAIDVLPATKFQIFSGILKAARSDDGKMRLSGVASSTTRDLHGDTMQSSAIEDMERAANNNLTIFLNHSYEVPEDVAGSVEKAKMQTRGVDGDGNPNYDLDMSILVNDTNPRAVKAFEAIERGTKLGLSIGALIPEGGAKKEKGNYIIEHIELLETSLVGIPANPRSWVEYAAKSLRGVEKDIVSTQLGSPTLTLDGKNYKIEGSMEGMSLDLSPDATKATTWIETRDGDKITIGDPEPEPVQDDTQPDLTAGASVCANCGGTKGSPRNGCTNQFHKPDPDAPNTTNDVTPDVADAQVTIIQIDTGEGSESDSSTDASAPQDGSPTNPDTGDGDHAASGADAAAITGQLNLDGPASEAMQRMLDLLTSSTRELVEAKRKVAELTASATTITTERDTANSQRDMVLIETKRVLDNLANTPLMRRAVVVEAERELRAKFSGIYSEDFLKMLETPK